MIQIRPLNTNDFPDWLPLWDANNLGQRNADVTAHTWMQLMDESAPVFGLCAVQNGALAGLVHYVLHPTTGAVEPVCYMQDVYVDSAYRGRGIGRRLVQEIAARGKREKWTRMYWLAESGNEAAQGLYKHIGVRLDFTLYALGLKD